MNFNINLATKVYVDYRKLNIAFLLIATILILWSFFSIYSVMTNISDIRRFTEYKARLTRGANSNKVSESDYTLFLANVKNTNSIIYKSSFDWLSLLANLEHLVPEGIALRGLEPSEKGAVLKLSGAARNFSSVRRFIENLESSHTFSEVFLTDQSLIKEGAEKVIIFTATCKASVQ